ncbi:MAG: flagellin, partial [Synergistaceae bacterium]|nr:flagellin [Synergistaceae bacterium]
AHSGKLIESGIKAAAGVRLHNIISDGIALDIDSDIGLLHSFYNEMTGTFDSDIEKQISQYVHLADNAAALHIGANEGENMLLTLGALTADALDINDLDVRTREEASRSITRLDNAIRHVSAQRAIVGAQISRLGSTISNLGTASLNLTNSRSRIADADIAKEMMEFTKLNIISKAANSMLAQANQINTGVLTLLG